MPSATTDGLDRARHYHRSRPPYARKVVNFVLDHAGHETLAVVADIGCGTGLSTALFQGQADKLIGVEPDPAMRAIAEVSQRGPKVEIRSGSAEQTGLPSCSVTLLVAASCFEWFDHTLVAAEFRRVLAPSGHVLLLWNHRVVVDSVTHAWDRLWLRHMGPRLGPDPDDIDNVLVPGFLEPGFESLRHVEHHLFDETRLRQFALFSGYAPRPSQTRRQDALQKAISAFQAEHNHDGTVRLAFETVAYLGVPRATFPAGGAPRAR